MTSSSAEVSGPASGGAGASPELTDRAGLVRQALGCGRDPQPPPRHFEVRLPRIGGRLRPDGRVWSRPREARPSSSKPPRSTPHADQDRSFREKMGLGALRGLHRARGSSMTCRSRLRRVLHHHGPRYLGEPPGGLTDSTIYQRPWPAGPDRHGPSPFLKEVPSGPWCIAISWTWSARSLRRAGTGVERRLGVSDISSCCQTLQLLCERDMASRALHGRRDGRRAR